jgi:hypothetical protein
MEMPHRFPPGAAVAECVREVRISVPPERDGQVAWFYAEIIGLPLRRPDTCAPAGWLAGDLRHSVYFEHRHDPEVDPCRRRLTLRVASLDALARRLTGAGCAFEQRRGLMWDASLEVLDPVGHRVEVFQSRTL